MAGRLYRALRDLLETYPAFVAMALEVTGKVGGFAATSAWLWLAARLASVVLYAAGVRMLCTLAWLVSIAGLLMMLARLGA